MTTRFKFRFSIGTIFEVKGKGYMVISITNKVLDGELKPYTIHFCPAEMTYKSVILGDKIYKKPAQELDRLRDEGVATYIGVREFPDHFVKQMYGAL